jgi:hypothetical protein
VVEIHLATILKSDRFMLQLVDRWRVRAVFLIVLSGGAGVEIVIAPGFLLA